MCGYDDDAYEDEDMVIELRDSEEVAGWMEDEECGYEDDADEEEEEEEEEEECGRDPRFKIWEEEV